MNCAPIGRGSLTARIRRAAGRARTATAESFAGCPGALGAL